MYWLATLLLAMKLRPQATYLVGSLLAWPQYDSGGHIFPLLAPGWTLSYEIFFYVAFAAALMLPRRLQLWVMTAGFGGLVAVGFAPALARWAPAVAFTRPLLLEFVAGLLLGRAYAQGRLPRPAAAGAMVALALAAFCLVAITPLYTEPWRLLLWGGPAALLVAGAVSLEASGVVLDGVAGEMMVRLGDASFCLYLFHGEVIGLVARAAGARLGPGALSIAAFFAAIAAAVLLHRGPESWLNRRLRAKPPLGETPPASAPGATVATIGAPA